jgi:DNA-binding FadR family transcriptional regulator
MQELLEARLLIEVGVAELAATRRSDPDLVAMGAAVDAMRGADADADVDGFVAHDIAFHQAVMAAAGNQVIAALFEPITQLLQETRRHTSRDSLARRHALAAHERILADIVQRSPGQAGQAMRDHLVQTGEDYQLRPAAERGRSTTATD